MCDFRWMIWVGPCLLVACGDDTVSVGGETDSDGSSTSGPSTTTSTSDVDPSDPSESDTDDTSDTDDPTETTGAVCPPLEDDPVPPTECTRECGSSDFDLEHISGINYDGNRVHALFPTCEGPSCPVPDTAGTYRGQTITRCEDTPAAQASLRGPEAYCRLSPIALAYGFELGFTAPPERASITEFRQQLDGNGEEEAYLWHTGIVQVEGPISRYRGRYERGTSETWDHVEGRNLTCIENLDALGVPYDSNDLDSACAATQEVGGVTRPLRMEVEGVFDPTHGVLDGRTSSCDTPGFGPDTCCSACDEQLSVRVARYGVGDDGARLSPNGGDAIACDPEADRFESCRGFVAEVNRRDELVKYRYTWDECTADWPLPLKDRLRETHPDARPEGTDVIGDSCGSTAECPEGLECIGVDGDGNVCNDGGDCGDRQCRLEWFGDCQMTEAGAHYCVDRRFRLRAAGACYVAGQDFDDGTAGERLAVCAETGTGILTPEACCQDALGNEEACDPFFQSEVRPVPIFDRDSDLGPPDCVCDPMESAFCEGLLDELCAPPIGDSSDPGGGALPGTYAYRDVRRRGGTRYDPELDGFDLHLGWSGYETRGLTEQCGESQGQIASRGPEETWLGHESFATSYDRDYNVAMCSGSTYTFMFAGTDDPEHLRTASGDTLSGKQRYVIETSDFLVNPGSGFPPDNLHISTCDSFSIRVSNSFDLSVENLRKPALWRVEEVDGENVATERIAGGRDCDPEATTADVAMGAIPCLLVTPENHFYGEITVRLDPEQSSDLLMEDERYRLVLPGLDDPADIADADAYAGAFHDACGMPLITGDLSEYVYEFTIDSPCLNP